MEVLVNSDTWARRDDLHVCRRANKLEFHPPSIEASSCCHLSADEASPETHRPSSSCPAAAPPTYHFDRERPAEFVAHAATRFYSKASTQALDLPPPRRFH